MGPREVGHGTWDMGCGTWDVVREMRKPEKPPLTGHSFGQPAHLTGRSTVAMQTHIYSTHSTCCWLAALHCTALESLSGLSQREKEAQVEESPRIEERGGRKGKKATPTVLIVHHFNHFHHRPSTPLPLHAIDYPWIDAYLSQARRNFHSFSLLALL